VACPNQFRIHGQSTPAGDELNADAVTQVCGVTRFFASDGTLPGGRPKRAAIFDEPGYGSSRTVGQHGFARLSRAAPGTCHRSQKSA